VLTAGTELQLKAKIWRVISELTADSAGFGTVYVVEDDEGNQAVAKLVDKDPGAERELLIGTANQAAQYRNVMPVLDDGEHDDQWVLVMPRAEKSLKQYLEARGGAVEVGEAVAVLTDIATALAKIKGVLVHRDLKPANVLLLNGVWSLSDFGLARYAESSTATDTWKHNATWQYASPEQWRGQHATEAADVYSFGVVGYELLEGHRPFNGPDLREQHLNEQPPPLTVGPTRLQDLIEECLFKAPEARPTPAAILGRLEKLTDGAPAGAGIEILAQANRSTVQQRAEADALRSADQEQQERLARLRETAVQSFQRVGDKMIEAIQTHATAADLLTDPRDRRKSQSFNSLASGKTFVALLSGAQIGLDTPQPSPSKPGSLPFTVVAESVIKVTRPSPLHGWVGRGHSLWFCDAEEQGRFAWYELAFTQSGFAAGARPSIDPFEMDGIDAREALEAGITRVQLAWDFDELDRSDLSEFVNRWLGWFGLAAQGQLQRPAMLPEKSMRANRWWRR
jgi:serine/threonine protein kinase